MRSVKLAESKLLCSQDRNIPAWAYVHFNGLWEDLVSESLSEWWRHGGGQAVDISIILHEQFAMPRRLENYLSGGISSLGAHVWDTCFPKGLDDQDECDFRVTDIFSKDEDVPRYPHLPSAHSATCSP